jgi:putative transposase
MVAEVPPNHPSRGRRCRTGRQAGGTQRLRRAAGVLTDSVAADVVAPRVNDKRAEESTGERRRFSSANLPPWCRKSPKVNELLSSMCLRGLSSQDIAPALWKGS